MILLPFCMIKSLIIKENRRSCLGCLDKRSSSIIINLKYEIWLVLPAYPLELFDVLNQLITWNFLQGSDCKGSVQKFTERPHWWWKGGWGEGIRTQLRRNLPCKAGRFISTSFTTFAFWLSFSKFFGLLS